MVLAALAGGSVCFVFNFFKKQQSPEAVRGTLAYLDVRYGFRDLNFEQDISKCQGMSLSTNHFSNAIDDDYSEGPDVKIYIRDSDELKIGNASLIGIKYVFYKNKLMAVHLEARSSEANEALKTAFENLYGEGKGSHVEHSDHFATQWLGRRAQASLNTFLRWDYGGVEVHARIESRNVKDSQLADWSAKRKSEGGQGAKDL